MEVGVNVAITDHLVIVYRDVPDEPLYEYAEKYLYLFYQIITFLLIRRINWYIIMLHRKIA